MKYYAKTYTADPKIGLLTPGEFLTEEQVAALGKDRLMDMMARGVLCAVGSNAPKAEKPDDQDAPDAGEDPDVDDADGDAEEGNDGSEDGTEDSEARDDDPEDEEEDLPELDGAGVIDEGGKPEVKSAKKPAKTAAKNGGGRNRK